MKEDFLHYLWQFQKWNFLPLKTVASETIVVHKPGQYLQQAGPDFFNALIEIEDQLWAGTVEIHLKSSDWFAHHHEKDVHYENVILHVVWEHDMEIYRQDGSIIPTMCLKEFVSHDLVADYNQFMLPKTWIYCEKQIKMVPQFQMISWLERLFFERLERKSEFIETMLLKTTFDWEAVLFQTLTKNFGLNQNGQVFLNMAQKIPFSIVRKESHDLLSLESLFLGASGLLETNSEDVYVKKLQKQWSFLQDKYKLDITCVQKPTFFKLRPDNFPTIRFVQLASLYHQHHQLFYALIQTNSYHDIQKMFKVKISDYWQTHYNFNHESPKKSKQMTSAFVDLILINSIIPLKFIYAKHQGEDVADKLMSILISLPNEKNNIIDKFAFWGIKASNSFESQALIELKTQYCEHRKCMQCAVGAYCLKG